MRSYSPFSRDITALRTSDLAALREASEGWYIEYKESVGSAAAIAKSISAFSNTYGGWLFYGIGELSKEHAVAGSFPGIKRADVDATLQRIRHAASHSLNPAPHFVTKVVWGPCEELGLEADCAIICIHVPWSSSAPHIHKGGHIYRRVADGSEPKPENDRFVLDQLWRRGDELRSYYRDLVAGDPEFAEIEKDIPYVRIMLIADLWHERNPFVDFSLTEASKIFNPSAVHLISIPFDTLYTSSNGVVARQLKNNDPSSLGLTWRLYNNLASDVFIPLPIYDLQNFTATYSEMMEYGTFSRFLELLGEKYTAPRIVDLNYLFVILIGVVEVQERILEHAQWVSNFYYKAKLLHFWRTVPFIDVSTAWESLERYGMPMCLDETVVTPQGTDPEAFVEIFGRESIEERQARIFIKALQMFDPIARALGVPAWESHAVDSDAPPYFEELHEAGLRAIEAKRRQNQLDL